MDLARCWGVAENGEAVEVAVKPHLLDQLEDRWPPMGLVRHDRASGRVTARFGLSDTWMIVPDVDRSGDDPSADAWNLLESELGLFAVKRMTDLVAVHAASIALDGKVVMVPGRSGAGKSTLAVAAAAAAGASVLRDEFTMIDLATALITEWPHPVRIKHEGHTERFHLATPSEPIPVGLLAFVARSGAETRWSNLTSEASSTAATPHPRPGKGTYGRLSPWMTGIRLKPVARPLGSRHRSPTHRRSRLALLAGRRCTLQSNGESLQMNAPAA
jgi:hypothetical protein